MKKSLKNKKIVIISLLLIIILIIIGVVVIKNINTTKKQNNENKELYNEEESNTPVPAIDMNNTENAKIEDGVKQNTSENILKDRNLNGISITEIQLNAAQDGLSHFTATVQNNTSNDFSGGVAKITFTNQDGSLYAELEVYIPEMKAGTTNAIDAATTADIANAYDFSIELEK